MSVIIPRKIRSASHHTRPTGSRGLVVEDKVVMGKCQECKGDLVTTGGSKGAFIRRKQFCSGGCSMKFFNRLHKNPHNQEMRKAKWKNKDTSKFIVNSPFRNLDGSLK